MYELNHDSDESSKACSFCTDSKLNCSCVVIRATDCRLCLWAKGWRTYLKCDTCLSEWHLHTLDKPYLTMVLPHKWNCQICEAAEEERIQSATILLRLCTSSKSISMKASPVTPESTEYSEPGTPPRKRMYSHSLLNSSSSEDEEMGNHTNRIKRESLNSSNIVRRSRIPSEFSDSTEDMYSSTGSSSYEASPIRHTKIEPKTCSSFYSEKKTRSRKKSLSVDDDDQFLSLAASFPSKRGSLDVTCRHVVRALRNKSLECGSRDGEIVSFKFQAAQLSDDIGEVRRRVYDVLPVLEGVGIVTRLGRLYVHHGLYRVPCTLRWIASAVDYAKNLVNGPTENEEANILRRLAAGKFLKMVIENGPQYYSDGSLIKISADTISEITELARLQSHSNAELKTLGVITLHMLVLLFLEGPVESMTMSELGERIQNDPEYIFMSPSQQQMACILHGKKPISESISRTKSGAGRRLYDVVSVLTGVSLVSTKLISRGSAMNKQNGYKSKCVHINPKLLKKAIEQPNDEEFVRSCSIFINSP